MNLVIAIIWAAVTVVLACMEFISTNTIFLGFSIMMAVQYLGWEKK